MNRTAVERDVLLALLAFLIAFALWRSNDFSLLVFPLRLFVTFIHELGHGTAALLTGGRFDHFELKSTGAGLAYSRGGVRSIIIPAGYMGTAIFGAMLLYVTNRFKRPEWIAIGLGVFFAVLTLFYSGISLGNLDGSERVLAFAPLLGGTGYFLVAEENRGRWIGTGIALLGGVVSLYWGSGDNALAMVVGLLSGVILMLVGYLGLIGYIEITRFTLNFVAFVVGLNAITDAWFLLKIVRNDRLIVRNDATAMAETVGLTAPFWAGLWILTAIALLGISVWLTFFRQEVAKEIDRASVGDPV